jgi:hypothetical protein
LWALKARTLGAPTGASAALIDYTIEADAFAPPDRRRALQLLTV